MGNLQSMTKSQLLALLAAVDAEPEAEPVATARQFTSLGFVVSGDGVVPSEGDVLTVPTKAGKTARVRLTAEVDPSQYLSGDRAKGWHFTYVTLKRGE